MSKRLNKRQQREAEEIAELESQKAKLVEKVEVENDDDENSEEHEAGDDGKTQAVGAGVGKAGNLFAALNLGDEDEDEDEGYGDEEETEEIVPSGVTSKSKKKKKKKRKAARNVMEESETLNTHDEAAPSSSSQPRKNKKLDKRDADEDELDKALREMANQYGVSTREPVDDAPAAGSYAAQMRALLSVDPKNLDPEVELKRFFGSKVIASATASTSTSSLSRGQQAWTRLQLSKISKIRTIFVKPKVTWPLTGGSHGLSMRELPSEEVEERRIRHGVTEGKAAERWYTFEHDAGYRQVQMQFLGAVRSHDPNELQALLSVYSWHVDTLLQMSEVYRQQGDVGTASDFCDRALFAYDRCLIPGFSLNGSCRLDFDRVESRPLFMALHRDVSHLVRRGLWSTAFSYAKVLLSLDPQEDPHGALLWLDFLAVKSNNLEWLADLGQTINLESLPGMAYATALATRIQEKKADHTKSNELLQRAILDYPQVVSILADKANISIPGSMRSKPYFEMQVAYSEDPSIWSHLLGHIYANRSAPLWKESENAKWFSEQLSTLESSGKIPTGGPPSAALRSERLQSPDGIPLWLVRHAYLSETYMGFLPPSISSRLGHAFDPLPPATAVTLYDNAYFNPGTSGRRRTGLPGGDVDAGAYANGLVARLAEALGGQNVPQAVLRRLRDLIVPAVQQGADGMLDVEGLEDILAMAAEDMPGAFPGVEGDASDREVDA